MPKAAMLIAKQMRPSFAKPSIGMPHCHKGCAGKTVRGTCAASARPKQAANIANGFRGRRFWGVSSGFCSNVQLLHLECPLQLRVMRALKVHYGGETQPAVRHCGEPGIELYGNSPVFSEPCFGHPGRTGSRSQSRNSSQLGLD